MFGICAAISSIVNYSFSRRGLPAIIAGVLLLICLPKPSVGQQTRSAAQRESMERTLRARLQADDENATRWRLLGRIQLELGKLQSAHASFVRAVQRDRSNAAAHFDLARVLIKLDREQAAIEEFQLVIEIADESFYADEARKQLSDLGVSPVEEPTQDVVQAGFEVRQFGGLETLSPERSESSPTTERPSNPYIRVETGLLYNSNVALTPISRNLFPGTRDSFQGFIAPTIDYRLVSNEIVTAGTSFSGDFNLNEGDFREFNLQSYRPGVYVERLIHTSMSTWVPRLQYEFAHDAFEGSPFGNRNAVTASLANFWVQGGTSFIYWTTDYTDFVNDGILPSVTSRDGVTHAAGFSQTFDIGRRHLDTVTTGIDVKNADIEGSDFAFDGISLFGEAQIPVIQTVQLTLRGGWGYRDYRRFEFEPSRNENVWQAGVELRKRFNKQVSIAAVFDYDLFDSDNALFAAERYVGGVVVRFEN